MRIKPEDVCYCAFTGKAAEVLRQRGCPNAQTVHKLLFRGFKTPEGKFIFRPRKKTECNYKIVVIDEISMLSKDLWERLLGYNFYILALGDPFQLPPVDESNSNHILDNPHVFLKTIFRQAQDSEIIQLSMKVRENKPISYSIGKETQVVRPANMVEGMYTWADQIITATNPTRERINKEVRTVLGKTGEPQVGDKIISLENHWDILDDKEESALVNGTIGYIKEIEETTITYPIRPGFVIGPIAVYKMTFENEIGEVFRNIIVDKKYFLTGKKTLTSKQEYWIYKAKNAPSVPCCFDYGYAITGHKAQGSEWNKVLVIEERFPFDKETHKKWVYTSITRGSNKVVLVR